MAAYEMLTDAKYFQRSFGCAFDIGGTRVKVIYWKGNDEKTKQLKLRCSTYPIEELDAAIALVKKEALSFREGVVLKTCGVSVRGDIKEKLEEEFGTRVENLSEDDCMMDAMDFLISSHARESYVIPPSEVAVAYVDGHRHSASQMTGTPLNQPLPSANIDTSMYPFLVVSMGTGCGINKVESDGTRHVLSGSCTSGKAFRGLGYHFAGTSNHEELIQLATKGDDSRVTTFMRELKQGSDEDSYAAFPDDWPIFTFGKAVDGYSSDNKPRGQDLVRAVLSMMCNSLAQLCYWVARAHQCKYVFVTGGFVESAIVQEFVAKYFLDEGLFAGNKLEINFLKPGSYLGCIGAMLNSAE